MNEWCGVTDMVAAKWTCGFCGVAVATHEIPAIAEPDARDLLTFMEMILKLVFEFPKRIPSSP